MLGIIIISSLIFLNSHSQILDMKDEVQVWGMAFTTKGIDWSPYMEQNSLLSFGYSLFLVPIITLFHSAGAVYKISIILNICFLCVAYILSLYVFYNMLPQVNKMKLTIISLFMALCPGLVIIKSLALPYLLIMVVFWMILALFISLFKKSESWKIVCIAFFTCVWCVDTCTNDRCNYCHDSFYFTISKKKNFYRISGYFFGGNSSFFTSDWCYN
ncbi:MAG: hypothetical protein RHS_2213 [Robinsoniella sp. RHS]|nr:MAG: hypothetical protein RHS_2213 [Robinsoniella sp. RHS]